MEGKKYSELNRSMMSGMKKISQENPELIKNFQGLHHSAMKTGALDSATKELMALACGIVTHCEGCIANHTAAALRAGAGKEAVYETISVAILMGGGPAMTYATKAVEALEELSA